MCDFQELKALFLPALVLSAVLAGGVAYGWPAGTPQPNRYALPPASDEVKAEAAAAKERLKGKLSPACLVGHRGDSEAAPQNTVPAFKAAAESGFNIETDIFMTKDGVLFVTHDKFLCRPGSGMNTFSTNAVWKGQLENADAGAWKGAKWKGVKYPTIDDVLEFAKDGRFIILEIKDPRKAEVMSRIREATGRHPNVNASNVFIQGGEPETLAKNLPGYRGIQCTLSRKGWSIFDPPKDMVAMVRHVNPAERPILSLRWDEDVISKEFVDFAHSRGFKVMVWTVDDAPSALAALGRGVDWICTNRPATLWKEMQ